MGTCCRIGTSGWVYPHWSEVFYPENIPQSQWLNYYAKSFNTVEINYSFYHLPSEAAFDHWRKQAPEGFTYAVKANRYLTHFKKLKDVDEPLERFISGARMLKDKLGPILWQLPPHWRANPERLETFIAMLPNDMTHVFEFRDPRWFTQPIKEILERFGISFCIFDMPGLECPTWVTAPIVYLRFHGSGLIYGGEYGEDGLKPWLKRIKRWLSAGHSVFAYFNNDACGFAIEDARMLQRMIDN
jgi:uncharacterized protein YecE (DUF72 family)